MTLWRVAVGSLLLGLIGLPLAMPLASALSDPNAWRVWGEPDRLFSLARNTALLTAGTLAVALPLGTAGAVLFYRTDLPGRRLFRALTVLTLFVPLPLFASGWQTAAALGAWSPWRLGLTSAVWIHAVAGLPWVVLLVGQGLCWTERELEEDALTVAGPWRVLFRVTLRRAGAAIGAAALWVALQTATEITITDLMQVRTFAEEVYTQFVGPEPDAGRGDAVSRALVVNLPVVLGAALLVGYAARRWERDLPARSTLAAPPLLYPLGRWRVPLALALAALVVFLVATPLFSLVTRAGLAGTPPLWSPLVVGQHLWTVTRVEGRFLVVSVATVAAAGLMCTALAFAACRLALESGRFRAGLLVLMAVAWAMPGPLVGLGLKALIARLLDLTGSPALADLLYYRPSPLPVLWAYAVRFFPCAVAVLWPVMRLEPRELRDAARVDGAGPLREWWYVALPLALRACVRSLLAVAVLSLGELSASKLVSIPGAPSYAEVLFTQMHYGVTNDLAARCLLMLGLAALGGGLLALPGRASAVEGD